MRESMYLLQVYDMETSEQNPTPNSGASRVSAAENPDITASCAEVSFWLPVRTYE